ncbi:hypothetical protein SEA_TIAMOCELI_64 [Gordonia phage Tiamoceli]|uniref:Uncharacterized protein n=1 Tax=Gordonia phage Tiamoceli TaxID=2510508 RepID=A0A411CSH4_9CAUD|nr:hypothetical protein J1598_gp64 [Gordonia phage Tiamoceli]QAY16808.1 hypothetical protein SEA_TIAMOCELI_64 [Gordonia phage Tiamoceli]
MMGGEPWQPWTTGPFPAVVDPKYDRLTHWAKLQQSAIWEIPEDLFDPRSWFDLFASPNVTLYGADWEPINPLDPVPAYRGPTTPVGAIRPYSGPQYRPSPPWTIATIRALMDYDRVYLAPRQHGVRTRGSVAFGGRRPAWIADTAAAIAEHAAGRDQRSNWARRYGTATITDLESWVWTHRVLDAARYLQ